MTSPVTPLAPPHVPTLVYAVGAALVLLVAYHLFHKR